MLLLTPFAGQAFNCCPRATILMPAPQKGSAISHSRPLTWGWSTSFMFFRFPNYTYMTGPDFPLTISPGVNGILVFHSRPLTRGHECHTCFSFTPGGAKSVDISVKMDSHVRGCCFSVFLGTFRYIWPEKTFKSAKKRPR